MLSASVLGQMNPTAMCETSVQSSRFGRGKFSDQNHILKMGHNVECKETFKWSFVPPHPPAKTLIHSLSVLSSLEPCQPLTINAEEKPPKVSSCTVNFISN